jgi:MYXO-CTERM domain-containing protein
VGQVDATGGTWGAPTASDGDFNLFANNAAAPLGTWYFTLTTADGAGDHMLLTSMTAVPEAPGISMMLAGLGLVGFAARRRKARA